MSSDDKKKNNTHSSQGSKYPWNEGYLDPWDKWLNTFENDEKYCEVSINNGIPTVLLTELTPEMEAAISKVMPKSSKLGSGKNNRFSCTTCRDRLYLLLRLRDSNGKPFFMPGSKDIYPEEFMPLWDASRTGSVTAVFVVQPFQFGMYSTGKWNHFSIGTVTTIPDIKDSKNRQRVLDKYIPIATKLFTANGVIGIRRSLDILIETLKSVTYGVNLLKSATWFREHITEDFGQADRRTQLNILTSAIFALDYCIEVGSGDVTIHLYHQFSNNTLDALAVCNNPKQLTALLNDRLNALKYQVKTEEASVGQVNNAMHFIGDFTTKLMTVENAIEEHGAVKVDQTSPYSASSAFSNMKVSSNGSKNKSGAAGFASRSKLNVKPKKMKDLMTFLDEKKLVGLEVYVDNQTPVVYATNFIGLKEGVYQTSHSWGFVNGVSPKEFNMEGWQEVVAIFKMGISFMFICKGALPNSKHMEPCCHPCLLTPEYYKSCGSAFGNLKDHMKLQINGKGPFAIGVGVSLNAKSLTDPNPPINGSITFRICETEFIIR